MITLKLITIRQVRKLFKTLTNKHKKVRKSKNPSQKELLMDIHVTLLLILKNLSESTSDNPVELVDLTKEKSIYLN